MHGATGRAEAGGTHGQIGIDSSGIDSGPVPQQQVVPAGIIPQAIGCGWGGSGRDATPLITTRAIIASRDVINQVLNTERYSRTDCSL